MQAVIREAVLSDLARISELNQQILQYEFQFGNSFDPGWTYSKIGQSYFKQRIQGKNACVLVAEHKGTTVGYIISAWDEWPFRRTPVIAELENMCVDESCRRQGIGTQLVTEMLKHLIPKHITTLRVETIPGNTRAQAFYHKHGFTHHSTILEKRLS